MAKLIVKDTQLKSLIKDKGIKLTANIQLYRQYQKYRGYGAKIKDYGGFGVGDEYERTISQNRLAQEFKALQAHPLNKRYTSQELFNVALQHEVERAEAFIIQKIPFATTPFKLPKTRAAKALFKLGIQIAEQPYEQDYEWNTSPDMDDFDPEVEDQLEIYKRKVKKAIADKMLKKPELMRNFEELAKKKGFNFDIIVEDAIMNARWDFASGNTKNIITQAIDEVEFILESGII